MVRIRFPPAESPSLNENQPAAVEKHGFSRECAALAGSAFGRDRHRPATWHHWWLMFLLGQIPVPRSWRWV